MPCRSRLATSAVLLTMFVAVAAAVTYLAARHEVPTVAIILGIVQVAVLAVVAFIVFNRPAIAQSFTVDLAGDQLNIVAHHNRVTHLPRNQIAAVYHLAIESDRGPTWLAWQRDSGVIASAAALNRVPPDCADIRDMARQISEALDLAPPTASLRHSTPGRVVLLTSQAGAIAKRLAVFAAALLVLIALPTLLLSGQFVVTLLALAVFLLIATALPEAADETLQSIRRLLGFDADAPP